MKKNKVLFNEIRKLRSDLRRSEDRLKILENKVFVNNTPTPISETFSPILWPRQFPIGDTLMLPVTPDIAVRSSSPTTGHEYKTMYEDKCKEVEYLRKEIQDMKSRFYGE